jgi:hypothetical protein
MIKLPSRQVHLDFHTSELIPDVGRDFDAAQWQAALRTGHLNSITVFAKCHHSWSYYPTQVGQPHPHLKRDLLAAQIQASHAIGVRAPIYYTVGWSATDAETHPEWVARNKDGSLQNFNYDVNAKPEDSKPITSWKNLCPSGTYKDMMLAQTREICDRYDVDGFFYDICFREPCYCETCMAGMRAAGLDPAKDEDAIAYNVQKWQSFMADCNAIIYAKWPEATIFYNGGASQYHPQWHVGDTHYELEDLPTTWGGYDKFPIRAKYFANTGKDYLAMSGKFHTTWGEFGGFKHPDAIKFEAASMIAYGARCSFGDQLHPNGVMDMATYQNLGEAYAYVEQIEPYGLDGQPAANLGLWLSGDVADDQGVANMLMESQHDFAVVHPQADLGNLSRYAAIILPGAACLTDEQAAALNAYAAQGGGLLVLGESGLDAARTRFILDTGATYVGPANYQMDYTVVGPELAESMVASPFLNYTAALRVALTAAQAQPLATIKEPYFDRTYGHYCSHQNTPNHPEDAPQPAAWRKGNCVVLAHRLGEIYYHNGARLHRQLFVNALKLIYTQPVVSVKLPSAGRVNVVHQPAQRRYVVHLLYAPPLQRGRCLVIEDLPVLNDVAVALRVPETIQRAYLAPSEIDLNLVNNGVAQVVVPEVVGHQAVVFAY